MTLTGRILPSEVTIFHPYKRIFPNRMLRLPRCFLNNVYSTSRMTPFRCGRPMALFQFIGCLLWTLHLKIKHVRPVWQSCIVSKSQPNVDTTGAPRHEHASDIPAWPAAQETATYCHGHKEKTDLYLQPVVYYKDSTYVNVQAKSLGHVRSDFSNSLQLLLKVKPIK